MGAYLLRLEEIVKNEDGSIRELRCTVDLETANGTPADGRKVKGTIHWVSATLCHEAKVMLYDHLLTIENPSDLPEGKTYADYLNPTSAVAVETAKLEPALKDAKPGDRFQFVRTGYFVADTKNEGIFNKTVGLKDSFPAK